MGRIINGIKHICAFNEDDLKKKSLEDNLYFTLRDIFWNCDSPDVCVKSCEYNSELSGSITYEERTDSFKYTNMLEQQTELLKILSWLERFTPAYFEFIELEDENKEEYIVFDDWWKHFKELIQLLREKYEKSAVEMLT